MRQLLVLLILSLGIAGINTHCLAKEKTATFEAPPESIAQWYKPTNKRQVWLHTMFRLRRAQLAIETYSHQKKATELEKWIQIFSKDYQAIGKMVPEWKEQLKPKELAQLKQAFASKKFSSIKPILKNLTKSCDQCHQDYQVATTVLYRSPNFENITIKNSNAGQKQTHHEVMEHASDSLNHIKIAYSDGYFEEAAAGIASLEMDLDHMTQTCSVCHKTDTAPVDRIFSKAKPMLKNLHQFLIAKNKKKAGRQLGEFAVTVCARCHGIHRTIDELRSAFQKE